MKLNFATKNYKLADNRSITILDIKSPDDRNFYFQLIFEENNKAINFNEVKNKLIASIKEINNIKKFTKLEFLRELTNLGFDVESTVLIEKNQVKNSINTSSKLNASKNSLVQTFDKNLSNLFILETIAKGNKNYYLSYEIPKDIEKNTVPLCSITIYSDKTLSKKIYLFPTKSLDGVKAFLNSDSIKLDDLKYLNILYVRHDFPFNENKLYKNDIRTRIHLQTTISEILTHLEKSQCFRKDGSQKVSIFRSLAKSIANGEALGNISSKLNEHDTWKLLAQHRDPWRFLSFFKGKTHSLITWETLRDEISNFVSSTHTSTPSK